MITLKELLERDRKRELAVIAQLIAEGRLDLLKVDRRKMREENHPLSNEVPYTYLSDRKKGSK